MACSAAPNCLSSARLSSDLFGRSLHPSAKRVVMETPLVIRQNACFTPCPICAFHSKRLHNAKGGPMERAAPRMLAKPVTAKLP